MKAACRRYEIWKKRRYVISYRPPFNGMIEKQKRPYSYFFLSVRQPSTHIFRTMGKALMEAGPLEAAEQRPVISAGGVTGRGYANLPM